MAGIKNSKQRTALINELCSRCDHPTAETLYLSLKDDLPNLSLGTVYRNLALLCAEGAAKKVSLDGADRYDGNLTPHGHFLCRVCNQMYDFESTADIGKAAQSLLGSSGGTVESYSLTLYGICGNCQNQEPKI